jgi:UDP-N-acetylmuramoyl-tripeptide--D-alanyl-D-alanine ligase
VFTLADIFGGLAAQVGARAAPAGSHLVAFAEAVIDSRLATPGALFIALPGERVDGHAFVAAALDAGARGALVRREWALQQAERLPAKALLLDMAQPPASIDAQAPVLLLTDDPLVALQRAARAKRLRARATVIGITGSVGKTSTKELTAAVLHSRFGTLKNPRSYNNEATMPLSLLQLSADHDVAVLEMGMWATGEIALLCDLARPSLGVVTNVGPSHLERLGSLEAIQRAKGELPRALPPTGTAILNVDDPRVRAMADETPAAVFFYGLDEAADLKAESIQSRGLAGIAFTARHCGERVPVELPLLGRHSVYTALAALSVGLRLGMDWEAMLAGLNSAEIGQRLVARPGLHGARIIDDSYNAAPASVLAALDVLAELDGRRIAVLGDMLELGSFEEAGHRQVGRRAAAVADLLVVCGPRARAWIGPEALAAGMRPAAVLEAEENAAVAALLRPLLGSDDYVLIKGSRGQAMESIVTALQRPPDPEELTRGGS